MVYSNTSEILNNKDLCNKAGQAVHGNQSKFMPQKDPNKGVCVYWGGKVKQFKSGPIVTLQQRIGPMASRICESNHNKKFEIM